MSALGDRVAESLGEPVVSASRVPGGSINEGWRVELESGRELFVKSRPDADAEEFATEAAGLAWLAEPRVVRVPEVIALGEDPPWLALEWVEPASLSAAGRGRLGRGLAELHRAGAPGFGSLPPAAPGGAPWRIGPLELPAIECESWPEVYADHRLRPLLGMARERDAIGRRDASAIEVVCDRIEELAGPQEPPARIHGDLWSGNVLSGPGDWPWLVDPAACGGHREVDLAMLRLFGQPGTYFFDEYDEVFPRAEGHEERVELWQLLPLLVHAVLFGGGYGRQAGDAARRYA